MPAITRDSLLTLEAYARERKAFRARVLSHNRDRTVHVGEHVTLLFEDELTIRYQIQEMLRIEKTFEEAGIQDELDVYNPLVPDGRNLKATMLIEYEDVDERRDALARLRGVEDAVYVRVEGFADVRAKKSTVTLEFASTEAFIEYLLDVSPVVAALVSDQPRVRQQEYQDRLAQEFRPYAAVDGRFRIHNVCICAVGRK